MMFLSTKGHQRSVQSFALFLLTGVGLLAADVYKLNGVKRLDQDLYKTADGFYIETQYCYHYTYGEEAILRWEGSVSMDNKIIWADDSTCKVKRIWRK